MSCQQHMCWIPLPLSIISKPKHAYSLVKMILENVSIQNLNEVKLLLRIEANSHWNNCQIMWTLLIGIVYMCKTHPMRTFIVLCERTLICEGDFHMNNNRTL